MNLLGHEFLKLIIGFSLQANRVGECFFFHNVLCKVRNLSMLLMLSRFLSFSFSQGLKLLKPLKVML
jgi:hypothetical protein